MKCTVIGIVAFEAFSAPTTTASAVVPVLLPNERMKRQSATVTISATNDTARIFAHRNMLYTIKLNIHAAPVVYSTVNSAHRHLPLSRLMAEMTATHGK